MTHGIIKEEMKELLFLTRRGGPADVVPGDVKMDSAAFAGQVVGF